MIRQVNWSLSLSLSLAERCWIYGNWEVVRGALGFDVVGWRLWCRTEDDFFDSRNKLWSSRPGAYMHSNCLYLEPRVKHPTSVMRCLYCTVNITLHANPVC
jgi:hypothetical protein